MNRARCVAVAVVVALLCGPTARADGGGGSCFVYPPVPKRPDRIVRSHVAGRDVLVLLPPAYRETKRRYPVLYLPNSGWADEEDYVASTDIIAFTDNLPDAAQVIVVTADGGPFDLHTDWRSGDRPVETFYTKTLIRYIDSAYRTTPDRAYRAVAGFSMGALGAMSYAARHPDLYSSAGSFSGFLDTTYASPSAELSLMAHMTWSYPVCYGELVDPTRTHGDPIFSDVWWHARNPTDLASNLGGLGLYVASGNGLPGDRTRAAPTDLPLVMGLEVAMSLTSERFASALTDARVPHRTDFYGNGTHEYTYVDRDLRTWWPIMLRSFGRTRPTSFDFRAVEARFSVYDWTFIADKNRATEFLDVFDASSKGLTLRGSGTTNVVTGKLFRPNELVKIEGASRSVRANRSGRITFSVSLGPPHMSAQYSPHGRVDQAAATSSYWTTARLRFVPQR